MRHLNFIKAGPANEFSSHASQFRVSTVDFLSPNEIRSLLDIDSPDTIALNAGTPRNYPRVNSYVLVSFSLANRLGCS